MQLNEAQQKVVLSIVDRGVPVLIGEFRLCKAEEITYKSKRTGAEVRNGIVRFTVEGESESFPVTEWMKEGEDFKKYVCPFKKGERVVVLISGFFQEKGQSSIRGTVHKL